MIIDLAKFIADERPFWNELEHALDALENRPDQRFEIGDARRFHYLYQRASADLARLTTFATEPQLRRYLESLVARAYGEVHETRRRATVTGWWRWFTATFPQTFRRHRAAFGVTLAITLLGCAFGGLAVGLDPDAKETLLPFAHLQGDPAERVRQEEEMQGQHLDEAKTLFSSFLMTHNTRVAITTLALGMTWGIGTLITLFYNGVILGAVAGDYILAGQTAFLLGWLMPHGVVEIPAILIAGQAGLVLGRTLIGWGDRAPLGARLRAVGRDLVTLIGGVAILLVWAGIIEAFLSQYHEPVIPYWVKITFGAVELVLLILFLTLAGRRDAAPQ